MKAQTNAKLSIVTAALLCAGATSGWAADHDIVVLSSRADMVTGGDALVELVAPFGIKRALHAGGNVRIHADVDGVPLPQDTFALRPDGRLYGLVSGLKIGKNVLTARFVFRRKPAFTLDMRTQGGDLGLDQRSG
jgi:hypothetical protein